MADLKILRRVSDRLCKEHNLSILPEKEVVRNKSPAEKRRNEWDKLEKETQLAVDAALDIAEDHMEFFSLMNKQGYQVRWRHKEKYVLFTNPYGKNEKQDF